ncbi:MAG TPA: TonB-dependent receptor [Gammaproteobacteria bacterium]
MRLKSCRLSSTAALLGIPLLASIPFATLAQQIEEILVTATRRETNLQDTPISIQAFTAEALELAGIEQGRDLGIMVPNVVLNPAGGGGPGGGSFYIRGLPGVGIYVDGVWQGNGGFLENDFIELERIEVLRGPQGTLFGRNTNGGAVNITTRRPADEFGARASLTAGEFSRRDATLAVDLPLSDTLKTKWTGARYYNDGFLDSVTVPRAFGGQDDTIFRGDILWEPTDSFSMRFTLTDENKRTSDPRIVQFTNTTHPRYLAYNVLAGNPDFLATARAIDPAFPNPPKTLAFNRFTPQTHEPGFPGGQLDQWQTRSDTAGAGTTRDLQYATMTLNWDVTEHFAIESITSGWEMDQRQVTDFDGSEFTVTTDDFYTRQDNFTEEIHFTGDNFNGKVDWLAGLYYLRQEALTRYYRWAMWEFFIPNEGPALPALDVAARDYVRAYGTTVGNIALATFNPLNISADTLTANDDEDSAFFGEVTYNVTEDLGLTFGVRVTSDDGEARTYTATEGFRPMTDQLPPSGDQFAGTVLVVTPDPDLGNVTTNKFAATYQINDDVMAYASWGEGFTSGGVTISPNFPDPIILDPEIITTREFGLRSDWMDGRLRFNATYFASKWDGLRVPILPDDPNNPGQKLPFPVNTSEGLAEAEGWEFELIWAPADRWLINTGIGLLDANYLDIGDADPTGINGIQPGTPFAYAPETSVSLGAQYDLPLADGGHLLFAGNYGWKDEYVRDPANQRIPKDANGNTIFEPAYGILNARLRYEPAERNWSLEFWGRNLTDEFYVNGGFDTRTVWGYDFTVVGQAREVGLSLGFVF